MSSKGNPPPTAHGEQDLATGRIRYRERAWRDAFQSLAGVDERAPLEAEDLERLGWAASYCGELTTSASAFERAFDAYCVAGRSMDAARIAFWRGFRLLSLGEQARAAGWLARAERLIEHESEDCVLRGYLLLPKLRRQSAAGDVEGALALADRAMQIAERAQDRELATFLLVLRARILVNQGQASQVLAAFDEAMVVASEDKLSTVVAGIVYCTAIDVCQRVQALDRTREWTSAFATFCDKQPQLVVFSTTCRALRAAVLQVSGAWSEALREAALVLDAPNSGPELEGISEAYYQQGDIYRLQGNFEQAEQSYASASKHGREPQPGLALLRMAQGQLDLACTAIRRVCATAVSPLERVNFLPACVEILIAAGDYSAARTACEELEVLVQHFDTDAMAATCAYARGLLSLAEGDAHGALQDLRRALAVWQQLGAPYLAARVRLALGQACLALGDEDSARLEHDAARDLLRQLGANADSRALEEATRAAPPATSPDHPLTPRELEVLRLLAKGITNHQIAKALGVSDKTIDRHVSNMFGKLAVTSRAAATAYAYEHGLL